VVQLLPLSNDMSENRYKSTKFKMPAIPVSPPPDTIHLGCKAAYRSSLEEASFPGKKAVDRWYGDYVIKDF
jgi:hypothetical protein